jgi:serine/threonine protein kinase/WD40 repeat protein
LLAAQPNVGEFLQAPAAGLPAVANAATVDRATDERPGTVLGPYKLLHEIGEGGMGTVWMAEQTEPVKRRVALKVIKPGMDSRQVLARFEAERQALALMDHPNIAKVLDAGSTEGGRPYFVMELVKGQPVTEFCDKNRLTTQERLELFVSVCNAIQHAHQKGVIHRDIKPSNVLVALYDGKPVPKVIDFGVAKAVGDPLTDKTLFTRHGQVVGTFEYMSPEQATLDQIDIDTRSDVYALGVLLYELLTGTTPLDKDELRRGALGEVLRRIREEEPPKPSTRLTSSPGLLATAAAYRKTDSQRLPRAVRGELDWIVMKALDKDRNRRFETANGLAADVGRFLKGEPVLACPPTLGYRFRKYARKHRVALATGTAIAAALLVGLVLTSWQAVRATNAEHASAAERDTAVKLGRELDTKLVEIKSANEQIHRSQAQQRADQYAWDMQMLPLTWDAGNAGEARRMLERQGEKFRGFEWHYWNQQTHPEVESVRLPGLPESRSMLGATGPNRARSDNWAVSGDGTRLAYLTEWVGTRAKGDDKLTLLVWDLATRKLLPPHPIPVEEPEGAAGLSDVSGFVSLSHDGKRVSVSVSAIFRFLVPNPEPGPLRSRVSSKSLVRVIDVDSGAVRFDSKVEGEEWTSSFARLSPDGRKLFTHTPPPPGPGGRSRLLYGRTALWDLDAADKKPVIIDHTSMGSFSPDGSRVIGIAPNGEGNGTATKVWDAASGKELLSFPGISVYASPRWTYLAAVVEREGDARARTLKVFDGTTGKEIKSTPLTGALAGPVARGRVASAPPVFSPDESLVAVAHGSTSGTPRTDWYFVEPQTGTIRRTTEGPVTSSAREFAPLWIGPRFFSGDGTQFICCVDNTIHTFDVASGRPVHTFRGHVNSIVTGAPAPKPDDQLLRTIEADGTLKEWDLRPPQDPPRIAVAELRNPVPGVSGPPGVYTVSAGGEWVAFAQPGRDVQVWDVAGKGPTILKARPRGVANRVGPQSVFLSADGKRVALYRVNPRRALLGAPPEKDNPENPTPPPDLTVWDVASEKELLHTDLPPAETFPFSGGVRGFSNDGATIVLTHSATAKPSADGKNQRRTTLWTIDVDTGREGPSITIDGNLIPNSGSLSPDGKRYADFVQIPAADGTWTDHFVVWDLVRGSQVFAIPAQSIASGDSEGFDFVAGRGAALWSPDGSRVVVLNRTGALSIALLDAATGKLVRTLTPSTRGTAGGAPFTPPRIAFSLDGRRVACEIRLRTGSAISVLDTDSGKEVLSLPVPSLFFAQNPFRNRVPGASLTFSPDGHRLLLFARGTDGSFGPEGKQATYLRVKTWDATPLPEPKQP